MNLKRNCRQHGQRGVPPSGNRRQKGSGWVIRMFDSYGNLQADGVDITFVPSMLFSPRIFICAFLFCVILNLASALVPAWKALRKPVVESLNQKR